MENKSSHWIGENIVDLCELLGTVAPLGGSRDICDRLATLLRRPNMALADAAIARACASGDVQRLIGSILVPAAYAVDWTNDELVEHIAVALGVSTLGYAFEGWFPPHALTAYEEKAFKAFVHRAVESLCVLAKTDPVRAARGVGVLFERALAAFEGDEPQLQARVRAALGVLGRTCAWIVPAAPLPAQERDALVDMLLASVPTSDLPEWTASLCPDAASAARVRARFDPALAANDAPGPSDAWLRLSLTAGFAREVLARCDVLAARGDGAWWIRSARANALEQLGDLEGALAITDGASELHFLRARILFTLGRPRDALALIREPSIVTRETLEATAQKYGLTVNEVFELRLQTMHPVAWDAEPFIACGVVYGRAETVLGLVEEYDLWQPLRLQLAREPELGPEVLRLHRALVNTGIARYRREGARLEVKNQHRPVLDTLRRDFDAAAALASKHGETASHEAWRAELAASAPPIVVDALGIRFAAIAAPPTEPRPPSADVEPPTGKAPRRRIVR